MTITYRGEPVTPHTINHAIQILKDGAEWAACLGVTNDAGFQEAIRRITNPCRAVGVAREAFQRSGHGFYAAIKELEESK